MNYCIIRKKKIIEQTGLIMELTGRERNILSNDEEKEIIRDILNRNNNYGPICYARSYSQHG